jgi:hypothetical protein
MLVRGTDLAAIAYIAEDRVAQSRMTGHEPMSKKLTYVSESDPLVI